MTSFRLAHQRGSGVTVIRISLSFFFRLGALLRPLESLQAGASLAAVWGSVYQAQTDIETMFQTEWFAPALRSSGQAGVGLLAALKAITGRLDFENGTISPLEASNVTTALNQFQGVLQAEFAIADAYYVTRKGLYDTTALVDNAEKQFPTELGVKVPGAIPDIRAAGKCLAFELSTASAFHSFRAVEAVLRVYWDVVSAGAEHPNLQAIGEYLSQMDAKGIGDTSVKECLRQLTKLHRNPLIHPERSIELDEAIATFGMCQSCIVALLKGIPSPNAGLVLAGRPASAWKRASSAR